MRVKTNVRGAICVCTPEEIAALVAFLACDESSFITGESILVDVRARLLLTDSAPSPRNRLTRPRSSAAG